MDALDLTLRACFVFVSVVCFVSADSGDDIDSVFLDDDVELTLDQLKASKRFVPHMQNDEGSKKLYNLWPNATLIYTLSPVSLTSSKNANLIEGMAQISNYTCVKFQHKLASDYNYAKVKFDKGCGAHIGMISPGQGIGIGDCPWVNAITHEILHTLGLIHEQGQSNRDSYVKVFIDNVKDKFRSNYGKYKPFSYHRGGVPYSYDSLMHYPATGFRKNSSVKTMETIPPGNEYRLDHQFHGISYSDVHVFNKIYRCASHCTEDESIRCRNNGVSGHLDKNCNCICEDGSQDCDINHASPKDDSCKNSYFNEWECNRQADIGNCPGVGKFRWVPRKCKKACNLCSGD